MKRVRKAVFPVAGFGTRFLPVTKAMPKELLPIINKPLIQYAVEEAISAGVDTLIFITGRNKRAIEDHFDDNSELKNILKNRKPDFDYEKALNTLPPNVQCVFLRQASPLGLGHAVLCAERLIGTEPFAVLLADDFIIHDEGDSIITDLISSYQITGKSQVSYQKINGPDISKYGVLKLGSSSNEVVGIAEKPSLENAPSNLAAIGRYVLSPEIFEELKKVRPDSGGEIQLSDALNEQAIKGKLETVEISGNRFDCGTSDGYLEAILHSAKLIGKL